ncbi:hypothetical protein KKF34_12830 [Myxococcota bacterium]|nr:hypothetical protein [Myxococcota bacterium]MBU1379964.1 hypothetical protein [Myxococcota bacterium]MBU1497751.1 hypothetical protein [Myxococcota bacterium]
MKKLSIILTVILSTIFFASCDESSSDSKGSVQFYVEPEWTIVNGIQPGDGEEEINDGWAVEYETFFVTLGDVTVAKTGSSSVFNDDNTYVMDLKNAPAGGLLVSEFNNVNAGDWDQVSYSMPFASATSQKLGTISDTDFNYMVNEGLAVRTTMVLTKTDGQTCPYLVEEVDPADPERPCYDLDEVTFDWDLPYAVEVSGCQTESQVGINIPSGGTTSVKLTLHADHHFFTAIRHTDLQRLAQPLINADLNADGIVTLEELDQVPVTVFDPMVYDLSTFPQDMETLLDYVRWTTITFPHFQGDGGCPTKNPLD